MNTTQTLPLVTSYDHDRFCLTAKRAKAGYRASIFLADTVAATLPEDGSSVVLFRSIGHIDGIERFGVARFARTADAVVVTRLDGSVITTTPLGRGRQVRLLANSAM